jgi:hypothetical protein
MVVNKQGRPVAHLIIGVVMASLACLSACGGLRLNPVTNERRSVHLEHDPSRTLTVKSDMLWRDGSPPAHELRFPAGIYVLEAEDDEYWYLRGAVPLEYKAFPKRGKMDDRNLQGGIMIGKYLFRAVPAGGYIDDDGSTKILIWKLGSEFINRQGKDWTKSF